MSNQKFLVDNLVKQAVLTPSTVNASYPVSNLTDDRRTRVFRSTNNNTTLVIDLGTTMELDFVALVDSGANALGFTVLTVEMNGTNSWVSPAVSEVANISQEYGFAYVEFTTPVNYRYVRLVLTNSAGYCEVAKLFVGKSAQIGELSFDYPIQYKQNNNATVTKNRLGQRFIDEINTQKEFSGGISTMNRDELDPLLEVLDYASYTLPVWLFFPEGNIFNDNNRLNGYYYLKDDPTLSFVEGNFWNCSLSFEEGT